MYNMSIPRRSQEMELNKPLAREIVRIFMEAVRIKRPFRLRTERRVIQRKTYLGLMRQFMVKIGKGTLRSIIQEQIVALNREYRMQMTIDLFADLLADYEPQKTRTIAIQTDPTDDDYWMGTDDEESEAETEDQAASKSTKEQSLAESENNATAEGSKYAATSGNGIATLASITSSQGLTEKAASWSAEGDVDMIAPEAVTGTSAAASHIERSAEKTTGSSAASVETHAASNTSAVQVLGSKVDGGESNTEEIIMGSNKPGVWTEAEKEKAEKYKNEIVKSMGPLGLSYYDEEDENLDETNEQSGGHSGDMAPPGVDNHEGMDTSFSKSVDGGLPNASEGMSASKFKHRFAKSQWSKKELEEELARIQIERLLIYRDDPDMYDRVVALEVRGKKFKASNDGNCPRCHFKKNAFVILDFLFPMGDMPEICNYLITKGQAVLWSSQDDSHCKDPPTFLCRGKCPADPSKCGFNLNWNKTDLESVFLLPREDEVEVKKDPKETAELKPDANEIKENVTSLVTSPTVVKVEESLEKVGEQSLESKEEEKTADEDCMDIDRFDDREIDLNHYKNSVSWVVLDEFTAPNEEVDDDEDHFIKTMLALSDAKEDWDKGEAKLWSDEESEGGEEKMAVDDGETQSTDNKKQLYAFSWDSYGSNPWAPVEFTKKNPQNLVMVASGKGHVPRLVNQDGSESQIDETKQPANEITKQASDMSDATPLPEATQTTEGGKIEGTSGAAESVAHESKDETSKDNKTEKPEKKTYTADDYPVSIDGICPYCKSAEVVYIIISNEEEKEDDNLPEILQKLLKINYAYKMPKDENEPPSFQCLKCTYGFNLDWSSTSLEDIFQEKLKNDGKSTQQEENISKGYGVDAKNKTTQSLTTSAQSYSYQMPTQATSSTYTAPAYPPPPVMGMNYFPPMGFPPMAFPPGYFPPPPGYFPTTGFPGYVPGMPGSGYMPYPMMGGPMTGPPPRVPMTGPPPRVPMTGPPPRVPPPAPTAAVPPSGPRSLMGPRASQWHSTGQTDTYKSGKYNQGSHVTSPTLPKGTFTKGGTTAVRGTITKGTFTKGTVTKGTVTKGSVTREADKRGTITKGTVTKGTVTKGPVPKAAVVKQTSSMGTNTEGSTKKRAATAMIESSTGSSKSKESSTGSSTSKESSTGSSKSKESSTGSSKSKESSTGSLKSKESSTGSSDSKESSTGSSTLKESSTSSSKSNESSTASSKSKKDGEELKKVTSEEHSVAAATDKTKSQSETTEDKDESKDTHPTEKLKQASDERHALTPVASINEPMPPGVISPTPPNMAGSLEPMESENSERKSATDSFQEEHQTIRFVDDKVEKIVDVTEELNQEVDDEGQSRSKRLKLQATDSEETSEKLDEPIDPVVEASQLTETDIEPEKVATPPVKTVKGKGKGRTRGRARGARGRKKKGS